MKYDNNLFLDKLKLNFRTDFRWDKNLIKIFYCTMKIGKKSIFRKKKFLPKLDRNFMADMIQIRKNLFLERKISYGNWTGILWQISGVILEWQKKIGHLLSVAPPSTECTKYPFWNVDNLICKQVYNHSMSFLKTKSFSLAALSKKSCCTFAAWLIDFYSI